MGWGSGSNVFSGVIKSAIKYIPDVEKRKEFYGDVYSAFSDNDWDTESDCFPEDPVFEEWYCNYIGTLPEQKQQQLAIQIVNNNTKKEDVGKLPDIVELGLEDNKDIVEEIWYYVEKIRKYGGLK